MTSSVKRCILQRERHITKLTKTRVLRLKFGDKIHEVSTQRHTCFQARFVAQTEVVRYESASSTVAGNQNHSSSGPPRWRCRHSSVWDNTSRVATDKTDAFWMHQSHVRRTLLVRASLEPNIRIEWLMWCVVWSARWFNHNWSLWKLRG